MIEPLTSPFKKHCAIVMLGVSLFLSIGTHQVCAADDDDTVSTNHLGRPIGELFKTEVVYPQEKGELEAEVTSVYQRRSGGDIWSVPISLEYGLTDQWQVEAEWNSFMQHHLKHGSFDRGIGDVEIGSQYSFMNVGDSLFHVAPRFSVGIPVGDVNKDFSEGFIEYEPAVVFARDIPELHYTQVFTEIGLGLVQRAKHSGDADDAEPAAHEFNLGAGFFTLFPHGAFTFEFNWTNNQWNNHGTENQLYVTPGILVRATKNIEIGLGIPVGLNQQSDRFDIAAHITCEF